jgi:aspartate/tyrosine/aromatic aminotransferase
MYIYIFALFACLLVSGVDPSEEQWRIIYEICRQRDCLPIFDNAYQGFVSGDPDRDAFPVRYFTEQAQMHQDKPFNMLVCCSFAKNFGLYGERVGALHVISATPEEGVLAAAQLRALSRTIYSTCPAYGARLVTHVLSDPARKAQWKAECRGMATRIDSIRRVFFNKLVENNVKGTWEHVLSQRGMFSYTGIDADSVAKLKADYHIYMLKSGRISMAGLNTNNVDRFVAALVQVLGTNN